jgi:hypothetical protein
MQIRRHSPAALAAVLLTTAAGALAASAAGSPGKPGANQSVQLDRACHETVAAVQRAVKAAPNGLVQSIQSHLQVLTPGVLNGKIAFNASGKQISLAGGRARPAAASFGCGEATAHGSRDAAGPGGSHVVSTLHRRFTKPGRYELTFTLNHAGETMLAGLAASDKAYFKQHPHGQHPPTLAFGVALSYSPTG